MDHYIKEREEAGSVSSKHKEIKENLKVREARRSVGQSLDALATMHDVKCMFSGRTKCVRSRNRSRTPRCACKHGVTRPHLPRPLSTFSNNKNSGMSVVSFAVGVLCLLKECRL